MDKEKQIEEMAKVINGSSWCGVKRAELYVCAEALYNAGYRKIPKGSEVVDRKVLEMFQKDEERFRESAKFYYEKCKSYGIENFYDPELEEVDD